MSSTYEQWISANSKLYDCYAAVQPAEFDGMSKKEQGAFCKAEKDTVSNFLTQNRIQMRHLIQEKMAHM
jgi:hypothetical protein